MSAYPFYRLIKNVVSKLGELLKGPSHQNWPDERWLRTIETHVSVSSFLQLGVVQTICTHFFSLIVGLLMYFSLFGNIFYYCIIHNYYMQIFLKNRNETFEKANWMYGLGFKLLGGSCLFQVSKMSVQPTKL